MRNGIGGLRAMVEAALKKAAYQSHLFVFVGKATLGTRSAAVSAKTPTQQFPRALRSVPRLRNAFVLSDSYASPAALVAAARLLGDTDLLAHGRRVARKALARPIPQWGLHDILYGLNRGGTATLGAPVFSSDVAQLKDDLSSIGYSVSDTTGLPDGPVFSLALTRALSRFQIRDFSLGTTPLAGMTLGILDIGTAEMINRVLQDTGP